MKSVFIPLNIKNKNGRIYTRESIETNVEDFLSRKNLNGVIYGEFNHPDSFDTSLSRVSHTIENIWFEGNNLMGEIKVLNTLWGKKLKDLISSGIDFSVRPRSSGYVDENGYVRLKKIFTFDIVSLEQDSFFNVKEQRKLKLNKILGIENKLPKLDVVFHILKNNELISD